jgi:hypothetical protein
MNAAKGKRLGNYEKKPNMEARALVEFLPQIAPLHILDDPCEHRREGRRGRVHNPAPARRCAVGARATRRSHFLGWCGSGWRLDLGVLATGHCKYKLMDARVRTGFPPQILSLHLGSAQQVRFLDGLGRQKRAPRFLTARCSIRIITVFTTRVAGRSTQYVFDDRNLGHVRRWT